MGDAEPGGDCLCGRGHALGTITVSSTRMLFRSFGEGPAGFHHERAAEWACADCIADTATAIASGQIREAMREIYERKTRPGPPRGRH